MYPEVVQTNVIDQSRVYAGFDGKELLHVYISKLAQNM